MSPDGDSGGDRLARKSRRFRADERGAALRRARARRRGTGADSRRREPQRSVRAVPRARAADGVQRPRTADLIHEMASNPNDRLRTVAYMYYEHHPTPSMIPELLKALEREESEFVRPALVRALAAQGSRSACARRRCWSRLDAARISSGARSSRRLVTTGRRTPFEPLMRIARLTGPLQVDAVIALGKLKDPRAMDTLAGAAAHCAARDSADDRGGHLPARRQLRRRMCRI